MQAHTPVGSLLLAQQYVPVHEPVGVPPACPTQAHWQKLENDAHKKAPHEHQLPGVLQHTLP